MTRSGFENKNQEGWRVSYKGLQKKSMNLQLGWFVIFFSFSHATQANLEYEVPLQIDPTVLYVDQEVRLQILVKPKVRKGVSLPSKLYLIKVDETGKRIEDLTVITDEGTLGDMTARDGYYSRKIKLIEREAGVLRLALVANTTDSERLPILAELQVVRRPSFLQVLGEVWQKVTHAR